MACSPYLYSTEKLEMIVHNTDDRIKSREHQKVTNKKMNFNHDECKMG